MIITGGFLKSRKISVLHGKNLRPTLSKTRQSVFNILSNLKEVSCSSFLDLFSGSGIMAFEAVSRGYGEVCCVECDRYSANLIKKNAQILGIEVDLIVSDAIKAPAKLNRSFDFIYVDPPYEANLYDKALKAILEFNVLKSEGCVIVEHPASVDVSVTGYNLLKEKKYSDKLIKILQKTSERQ